ncbi:MAG: hypothetical protein SNG02_07495 [Rikenellaceae bacterium]
MKKIILLSLTILLSIGFLSAQEAKSAAEISKERKEILKMSRDELNQKATRDARKDAKKLQKEGWKATPGALPLEKQLDRSYIMQYEYDESGYQTYLFGEAMSVGQVYDGAKVQALELAKLNLVSQIQSDVSALMESTVANEQLDSDEAATVVESVMASKSLISQSIGRTITVVEVYRDLSNKNVEVMIRIAYNSEMARKAAIEVVRKDLKAKGNALHEELDEIIK